MKREIIVINPEKLKSLRNQALMCDNGKDARKLYDKAMKMYRDNDFEMEELDAIGEVLKPCKHLYATQEFDKHKPEPDKNKKTKQKLSVKKKRKKGRKK